MADKLVAKYKEKEFNRLKDYALNQLSKIECSLNPSSISRGLYDNGETIVPSMYEARKLFETLTQLRSNILSSEERSLLNEIRRR